MAKGYEQINLREGSDIYQVYEEKLNTISNKDTGSLSINKISHCPLELQKLEH